jgi:hypothetical protein
MMILLYILKLILSDLTFTEIIIQLHCMTIIEFVHSRCVLYTSPMIVNVCSICHLANSTLCCTRIISCCFFVFFLIFNENCSACVFMFNFICILCILPCRKIQYYAMLTPILIYYNISLNT